LVGADPQVSPALDRTGKNAGATVKVTRGGGGGGGGGGPGISKGKFRVSPMAAGPGLCLNGLK